MGHHPCAQGLTVAASQKDGARLMRPHLSLRDKEQLVVPERRDVTFSSDIVTESFPFSGVG